MSKPAKKLPSFRTEVLTDNSAFDSLQSQWDDLLDDSNQRVYFLRWGWTKLWWQTHAPANSELHIITCYDSSDTLIGLAPFYKRTLSFAGFNRLHELVFLGTGVPVSTSEQLDIIARRGFEQAVAQAIGEAVLKATDIDRLWLSEVPITSIVLPHFRRALGGRQAMEVCNRAHYVNTSQDWTAFNKSLGKSMRSNLSYYTRRLYKLFDCHFRAIEEPSELEPAMDAFVRLHQARWKSKGEPGSFALPSFEGFLREAMRSSLAEQRLRLWTLDVNNETAAVLLAFVDNRVAHYFQGGFDPAYAKESLGTVMCGLCIRTCIEAADVDEFNFMGGDPSYKEKWTAASRESVVFEWLRPGFRSQVFALGEQGMSAGYSFLRLVTPTIVKEQVQAARRKLRRSNHKS
jgi:CelD/BcsL family acetyltransferase involved in cellulose biosynthesis